MKVFLPVRGHANAVSLPLRFGIRITDESQQFMVLHDAAHDEEGTNGQRPSEIERGNHHYVGTLEIKSPSGQILSSEHCRVVLETPSRSDQSPKVITIMDADRSLVKGDNSVTQHLGGMKKSGRITDEDLLECFHPAYVAGKIRNSNDCEMVWTDYSERSQGALEVDDPVNRSVVSGLAADQKQFTELMSVSDVNEVPLTAPLTYVPMNLPNVRYDYVMADAYVHDVQRVDDRIHLTVTNSKGSKQTLKSFPLNEKTRHLAKFHEYAFGYLESRVEQRAKFAIEKSGTLAESVTAIALQMNRIGIEKF
ncbi:hypothetical protein OAM26_04300 [Porticoccaceae bacterium]|nr:hypothetical protein [Porticoccaceae bacterium]